MKTIALPCATASEQYFVRPRYIRYLEKAAAMCEMDILPVLLPPTENPQTIRTYAEQYDGYLFSGGFDVVFESVRPPLKYFNQLTDRNQNKKQ